MDRVDLGLIYVVSRRGIDKVYLAHNDQKAFTVSCRPGNATKVGVSEAFRLCPTTQWKAVFELYVTWKRTQLPTLKLPNHSGLTKDGHEHPWRSRQKRQPRITPDSGTEHGLDSV